MNETEIDFVLITKEHRRFIQNVKTIHWEFQHALVIAEIDKKKIRKVVRKTHAEGRKISLLKNVKIWKRFEEKVIKVIHFILLSFSFYFIPVYPMFFLNVFCMSMQTVTYNSITTNT